MHPLDDSPPLIMAGVRASEELGASATSDGDVVAHAVADALLGAAVLGDIGEHFPSTDPAWRGADSMMILRQVAAMTSEAGWETSHLDVTVISEAVRVSPHREEMRERLAGALGIGPDSVSVKASTTDGLGLIGRGEGIAAMAVVTLAPRQPGP